MFSSLCEFIGYIVGFDNVDSGRELAKRENETVRAIGAIGPQPYAVHAMDRSGLSACQALDDDVIAIVRDADAVGCGIGHT